MTDGSLTARIGAGVAIRPLADCTAVLPRLATWLHDTWHAEAGYTQAQSEGFLRQRCRTGTLPICYVALSGDTLAGTASLLSATRDEAGVIEGCHLCSFFVRRDLRGYGIGTALLAAAVTGARDLGQSHVTAITEGVTTIYTRQGWHLAGSTAMPSGQVVHRYIFYVNGCVWGNAPGV